MKTHGGRAFLHGHLFGDNVHEYLAPCIYEGEGEMLGMGFFKSLIKEHGKTFFEPIGQVLGRAGIRAAQPAQPRARCGPLRGPMMPYAKWWSASCSPASRVPTSTGVPDEPRRPRRFAAAASRRSRLEISDAMRSISSSWPTASAGCPSSRSALQDLVVILTTSLWAARQDDETRAGRRRRPLPGPHPQAHRPAAHRQRLPRRHQARRGDRGGRVRGDRRASSARRS